MPQVTGSTGKIIDFEIKGVSEFIRMLENVNREVVERVDRDILQLAISVEEELKLSVAGMGDEPKSVDTGHFINDIRTDRIDYAEVVIHAPDTEYAEHLEYGTSRMAPRWHFTNTAERNKLFCEKWIKNMVTDVVKKEGK